MLNNKKFNIVLSLIIAVCLWIYVIGETNPTTSKTFRDIPIQLLHEEVLEEEGLALLETSAETINVTVSGTRANVSKIDEKDITAVVDLSDAAKGENQLKIKVKVPEDVEIEDQNLNKLTVTVEDMTSKEVDIRIVYEGSYEEDQEPITVDQSRDTVVVTGAASQVEQVAEVKAVVEEGKVKDQLKTFKGTLVAVDAYDREVTNVTLSAQQIQISAELAKTKTVPLTVPTFDGSAGDLEKQTSAPKTIIIKGKSSVIDTIESVTTQVVDLSDVEESTTITLTPILPDGVQASAKSTDTLVLKVTVEQLVSKTFTFDPEAIELTDLGDGLEATLDPAADSADTIQITVRGKQEVIDTMSEDDFALSASLADLQEGTWRVAVSVECGRAYKYMEVTPKKIRVTLETTE